MSARCPSCLRERIEGHPAGLVFDHGLACPLLAAEDATHAADVERLADCFGMSRRTNLVRATTDAERTLLAACGWTAPADAITTVRSITAGIVNRSWPGIDLDAQRPSTGDDDARGDAA